MWPVHLLAVAASGLTALSVVYPSATRQYTWPWAPLLALLWLTPLVATIGRLAFQNSWTWPNPLLNAGLMLLTTVTLLSAAFSPFAHHSLLRIWPTVAGVCLFFWLYDWLAESPDHALTRTQFLAKSMAGFGALLAVVSVLGWIWLGGGISWSTRNDFPFGHSIYTAGAMLLILPWLVSAALKSAGRRRAAWIIATLTGFFALLTTSSRAGVMAAGAVCTMMAGFAVIRASWSRRIKVGLIAIAICVLGIGIWSNPRLRELTRGQGWSAASQESNAQRRAMLEAGAKLGASRPLLGWGPGTVPLAYPLVRSQLSGGVDDVLQLHNTPAQLWATLGIGGVLALILLIASFVRRSWRIVRQSQLSAITLASGSSLVGYGLFTLTDHELDVPAMNVLLAANLALFFLDVRTAKSVAVSRAGIWRSSLAAALLLAVPVFLTGKDLLARYAYEQSLILLDAGRSAEGLEFLGIAADRAPYDPYYRHQLAGRLLERRNTSRNNAEVTRFTQQAATQLEQSLTSNCFQEFAHFNLGWLALDMNEPAKAIPHFLATVREAPHRGGAYFGLGLALRDTGNEAAAVRAFALEWINDPSAFTVPLWEWPDFAPLRPKILREADSLIADLALGHPTAHYVRNLWNWWERGTPPPSTGFNSESSAFLLTLEALANNQPVPPSASPYSWAPLLNAWNEKPANGTFKALAGNDAQFAAALTRRATRHGPPNVRAFLTAGLEREPYLLVNTRFSRLGYGVLALHPDGPVLTNLYVMQQNRLVATFMSGLFPPKGWLPAHELLSRLPPCPIP